MILPQKPVQVFADAAHLAVVVIPNQANGSFLTVVAGDATLIVDIGPPTEETLERLLPLWLEFARKRNGQSGGYVWHTHFNGLIAVCDATKPSD